MAALQQIVQGAESDRKRVRAIGSGWSLNSIAFVEDYLVNTSRLTSWSVGFETADYVEPSQHADIDRLVFAQCGVQIKTLNTYLEAKRLALPTSGASNGQTIAGAISTGTHGSAVTMGSMSDCILGLHIVGEAGAHYWLERPSKPTMTSAFSAWLGADLVRDEDLFLAAIVGFGSFGLIHAVLLKAEPLYTLELFIKRYDYAVALQAACTHNVAPLGLPQGATMPFHFEVVFHPYMRGQGDLGAFVRVMYKKVLQGPPPAPVATSGDSIMSRDLVSIAGDFSDGAPALVPPILLSKLKSSMPSTAPGTIVATPGIQFGDSQPTHGGTSMEVGVPFAQVQRAVEAIVEVTDAHVFGAPLALRFVAPTEALLGFTCHGPITCTMEMPGIDSDTAKVAHGLIFQALSTAGIPATYHWGQQGPFTYAALLSGYGPDRLNRWLAARRKRLSVAGRRTFSNDLLDACGLSQ